MRFPPLKEHLIYYAIAALIQLVGLVLITFYATTQEIQMSVVVLMTLVFVLWALAHHYFHHDLHPRVVIEYVLMGSVGITLTYFVLSF